eukprot:scaffold5377_cov39-Tisochrysis_lutea.AAC.1
MPPACRAGPLHSRGTDHVHEHGARGIDPTRQHNSHQPPTAVCTRNAASLRIACKVNRPLDPEARMTVRAAERGPPHSSLTPALCRSPGLEQGDLRLESSRLETHIAHRTSLRNTQYAIQHVERTLVGLSRRLDCAQNGPNPSTPITPTPHDLRVGIEN